MGRTEKSAASIGIIGGADGPTAVCTAGRKIPLKHRIRRMWYDLKRKRIAKRIKPEPHSMEEVMQYLQSRYGFTEMDKDSEEYIREYQEMRCSSILQYAPELLGEYATPPRLTGQDEEGIRKFQAELEKRQQCAAQIPKLLSRLHCRLCWISKRVRIFRKGMFPRRFYSCGMGMRLSGSSASAITFVNRCGQVPDTSGILSRKNFAEKGTERKDFG